MEVSELFEEKDVGGYRFANIGPNVVLARKTHIGSYNEILTTHKYAESHHHIDRNSGRISIPITIPMHRSRSIEVSHIPEGLTFALEKYDMALSEKVRRYYSHSS